MRQAVIVHGGIGASGERAVERSEVLRASVDAAWRLLNEQRGEEAVIAALAVLESNELFNAGYGSALNEQGQVRCDVGLMRGQGDFVAFTNMRRLRNPSRFAGDHFPTGSRLFRTWTEELMREADHSPRESKERYGWVENESEMVAPSVRQQAMQGNEAHLFGNLQKADTVGCVVRDSKGRIFAGTSTGGVSRKPLGRIGDCPIVGAGLFADDNIGGLSATGDGEFILSSLVSGFVLARLRKTSRATELRVEEARSIVLEEIDIANERNPRAWFGLIVMPHSGPPVYGTSKDRHLPVGLRFYSSSSEVQESIGVFHRA